MCHPRLSCKVSFVCKAVGASSPVHIDTVVHLWHFVALNELFCLRFSNRCHHNKIHSVVFILYFTALYVALKKCEKSDNKISFWCSEWTIFSPDVLNTRVKNSELHTDTTKTHLSGSRNSNSQFVSDLLFRALHWTWLRPERGSSSKQSAPTWWAWVVDDWAQPSPCCPCQRVRHLLQQHD